MSGTSWPWSLMLAVNSWATMIWAVPSTAAWALKPWMNPSLVNRTRLSGSVKLRCDLPAGSLFGGAGGLPVFLRPAALRSSSAFARRRSSSSAAALVSASSSALAWRIFSSRFWLSATQSGRFLAALFPKQPILFPVGRLGRLQPTVDLRRKLRLPLLHALIAHRLVFGGVRLHLGAVECHVPEPHQPRPFGQLQHLNEQAGKRLQMPPAELRDGAEIRRIARYDHHEAGALHRRLGDPPRGVDAARIAMQKQRRHHAGLERRLPQPALVAADDRGKIKLLPNECHNQPRQVVPGHIVLHARRQKLGFVYLPGAKFLAHNRRKESDSPQFGQ